MIKLIGNKTGKITYSYMKKLAIFWRWWKQVLSAEIRKIFSRNT